MLSGAKSGSKQIGKMGAYLKKKMNKNKKETKVKDSTKSKFKLVKKTSNAVYTFSSGAIKGLIKIGEKIGNKMVNNFESSKSGKKI